MKEKLPRRIVIYTKDVECITGRKYNAARRLLLEIRKQLGKAESEFITVTEFCRYTGLAEDQVMPFLRN